MAFTGRGKKDAEALYVMGAAEAVMLFISFIFPLLCPSGSSHSAYRVCCMLNGLGYCLQKRIQEQGRSYYTEHGMDGVCAVLNDLLELQKMNCTWEA